MLHRLRRRFFENPLIGKELAAGLTAPRLGVVFTFVTLVYLATDALCFFFFWSYSSFGPLNIEAGAFLHTWHSIVGYGVLAVLLPLRLAGHIEGPRAGRAFDQVVVTGVSPLRMCLGNWALGLVYAALVLAVTLPYEILAYVFGNITISHILESYGTLLLYSNVIIGISLGIAVATSEWLMVPLTVCLLAVFGILSGIGIVPGIPDVPAAIAELSPLRSLFRQALTSGMFDDVPTAVLSEFLESPRIFFSSIPV
ncbi:MAG: hypothetical protein V3V11_09965, partial [Vicinamibacteria bacterium]